MKRILTFSLFLILLISFVSATEKLQENINFTTVQYGVYDADPLWCQYFTAGVNGEAKTYPVSKFGVGLKKSSGDLTQDVIFSLRNGTGTFDPITILHSDVIPKEDLNANLSNSEIRWYYWTPSVEQTIMNGELYALCLEYHGGVPDYIQMGGSETAYDDTTYHLWHSESGHATTIDFPFQVWEYLTPTPPPSRDAKRIYNFNNMDEEDTGTDLIDGNAYGTPPFDTGDFGGNIRLTEDINTQGFDIPLGDLTYDETNDFTLQFLYKVNTEGTGVSNLQFAPYYYGSGDLYYIFQYDGSVYKFQVQDTLNYVNIPLPDLGDGQWHLITLEQSATDGKIYAYVDKTKYEASINYAGSPISEKWIFARNYYSGSYFDESFDNIKIFGVALTDQEVNATYDLYFPPTPPTPYFDNFNDGVCDNWIDMGADLDCSNFDLRGSYPFIDPNVFGISYLIESPLYIQFYQTTSYYSFVTLCEKTQDPEHCVSMDITGTNYPSLPNLMRLWNDDIGLLQQCNYVSQPNDKINMVVNPNGSITVSVNDVEQCSVVDNNLLTYEKNVIGIGNYIEGNSNTDNVYVGFVPPCTPDWSCTGYETCVEPMVNASCNTVVDLNTCGDGYGGDYSEFTPQTCSYPPPITGYVPLHNATDVPAVAIDSIVEVGLEYIKYAGLIAIVGLGVWAMVLI